MLAADTNPVGRVGHRRRPGRDVVSAADGPMVARIGCRRVFGPVEQLGAHTPTPATPASGRPDSPSTPRREGHTVLIRDGAMPTVKGRGRSDVRCPTMSALVVGSCGPAGRQSFDLRSSPVAMRPPVGLPTMSKRAKRVLIALVSPGRAGDPVVPVRRHLRRLALVRRGRLPRGLHHPGGQPDRHVPDRRPWSAAAWSSGRCTLAYRSRPVFVPTNEVDPLAPYRTIITSRPKLFAFGVSGVVGLICGLSAQSDWTTVQLWLHGGDFGTVDPQFGNDVGFYVFTLPMIQLVLGWLFVHHRRSASSPSRWCSTCSAASGCPARAARSPRRRRCSCPCWSRRSCCSRPCSTGTTGTSCCSPTAAARSPAPPTPTSTRCCPPS